MAAPVLRDMQGQGALLITGDGITVELAGGLRGAGADEAADTFRGVGIRVTALPGGPLEVLVCDDGPGIPPAAASRIFEPFFQLDGSVTRAQGGTGVGLAVARGVARGHDGDLVLRSEGKSEVGGLGFSGACFALTIARQLGTNLAGP